MDEPNQLDSNTVKNWRRLQLDIQVVVFPFHLPFFLDQIKVRVTNSQSLHSLIQYNLSEKHSYASHGRNPYRSIHLARAKKVGKCSSRTFRHYSSSISSASSTMRPQVVWSRSTSPSGSHRNSKSHSVRFSPFFPPRGCSFYCPRYHCTHCPTVREAIMLHSLWRALPPWYDFWWWTLFGRRTPSVRRWQ
jgi:hypothetical protein